MYEEELINVLNARVKELEKKNAELEEKHLGECRLISQYDSDLREMRYEIFRLIDENSFLRMWIHNKCEGNKSKTVEAVAEALKDMPEE